MDAELIIKNGFLFSPDSGEAGYLSDHFIRIVSGIIKEVGPMDQLHQNADCQVVDASGCLMMPGLVNGHCHGAMTLFRGLADDLELKDWLENHIFPAQSHSHIYIHIGHSAAENGLL